MKLHNRLWTALFLAFFSVSLFHNHAYAQALERVNAVYASLAGDHAALYVAQDMALFRKYGLDVSLSYTAGAAQVIQTMMAGENQIATAGGSGVVDADFGGADLVAVAGMVNMPAFYPVVQPEIKSIQDLRGKPVGITRFGSSTDFTMRYILRKDRFGSRQGCSTAATRRPAGACGRELKARQVFAAPMTPPALAKNAKGGSQEYQIPPKTIGLSFPHVGLVVRKQFLAARRQTVKNFIAGYSEGIAMLHRDKDASKKAIGRFLHTDDPESLEASWQFGIDVIEHIANLDPGNVQIGFGRASADASGSRQGQTRAVF